jgi:hypothetical protein
MGPNLVPRNGSWTRSRGFPLCECLYLSSENPEEPVEDDNDVTDKSLSFLSFLHIAQT